MSGKKGVGMKLSKSVESNRILYTPSVFAKSSLFHLQEVGELAALAPHTSTRENLNSYLFFIVLEGSGTLKYSDEEYELKAGDCVFLDCRRYYAHSTSEKNLWKLKWVHFYGPNMVSVYSKYSERGGKVCFATKQRKKYVTLLDEIYDIADSDDYIKDMKINDRLSSLLTLIMSESWDMEGSYVDSKRKSLQEVKEYIDEHFSEKMSLDELAKMGYVSKFYFTRLFKEQFGLSVNSYIIQMRITKAKELLRFSDKSIEEIGSECGMEDANYFARMFKKVEGISPREYRKQW